MSAARLILASQSPRRAQLLQMLGLEFEVMPADVDETYADNEPPREHCERLAREKAQLIASRQPAAVVIGSDTVVVLDGHVLGKPGSRAEAIEMLTRLQGREHQVSTGIAVAAPGHRLLSGVENVKVRFEPCPRALIEAYVDTGEPMDKAGAYGIQGYGSALVQGIEGDFFAVMGLPVGRMLTLLLQAGWRYNFRGLEPATAEVRK